MAAPIAEPDTLPVLFVLYKSSSNLMHIQPLLYQEVTLKTKQWLIKIFILSRRGRKEMERKCESRVELKGSHVKGKVQPQIITNRLKLGAKVLLYLRIN